MPPKLQFSGRFKRGVLIIDMVGAVKLAQSVGIVEPSGLRNFCVWSGIFIGYVLPVRVLLRLFFRGFSQKKANPWKPDACTAAISI